MLGKNLFENQRRAAVKKKLPRIQSLTNFKLGIQSNQVTKCLKLMDRIAKAFQFFFFFLLAHISNLLSRVNKWNRHFCVLEKLSVCEPYQEKKTLSVLQRKEIPLSLSTVFFSLHRFYSTIHSKKRAYFSTIHSMFCSQKVNCTVLMRYFSFFHLLWYFLFSFSSFVSCDKFNENVIELISVWLSLWFPFNKIYETKLPVQRWSDFVSFTFSLRISPFRLAWINRIIFVESLT